MVIFSFSITRKKNIAFLRYTQDMHSRFSHTLKMSWQHVYKLGINGMASGYQFMTGSIREKGKKLHASPFTVLEPRDQGIGKYCVVQKRRATDFEAPKLWKGRSLFLSFLSSRRCFCCCCCWCHIAWEMISKDGKKGRSLDFLFLCLPFSPLILGPWQVNNRSVSALKTGTF